MKVKNWLREQRYEAEVFIRDAWPLLILTGLAVVAFLLSVEFFNGVRK